MTQKNNLNEAMKNAEKEFGLFSAPTDAKKDDYFKLLEGANRVRILTPLVVFPQHFNKAGYTGICLGKDVKCPGCAEDDSRRAFNSHLDEKSKDKKQMTRNIKWMCWVLDYVDNEVKLAKLPHKVATMLQALQNDPQYAFEEFPMPYAITINAIGAGTTKVVYTIMSDRQNSPTPEDVVKALGKKSSVEDIKDKMQAKKAKELGLIAPDAPEKEIDYPTAEEEGIDLANVVF